MELSDAVRRRRMVRNYTGEPVDPGVLERIVDLARRAPSAGFSQGQTFVVVTAPERRRALAAACGEADYLARGFEPWLSRAPVHVIPCVEPQRYHRRYAEADKASSTPPEAWEVPFWWVDGGQALQLLLLAAVDEGLAAGFLAVASDLVRPLLELPEEVIPLGLVTIGHPATDRPSASVARGRREWSDQVRWEAWPRSAT